MITIEFVRAYLPENTDPDTRYGAWDYHNMDDFETHVREMKEEGQCFEVNRSGTKPVIYFFA